MTEKTMMEELIRGAENAPVREAGAQLLRDPMGDRQMLFFRGDQGVGKTWLLKALARELEQRYPRLRVVYITSSDLLARQIWAILHGTQDRFRRELMETDVLMLEDIFYIAGKETTERMLCHLLDGMTAQGKRIIFSDRRPPAEFPAGPLGDRMMGAKVLELCLPDFPGRMAIARDVAEEMALSLPGDVLELLARELDTPWCISGMVKRIAVMHRMDRISLTRERVELMMRDLPMKRDP